MKNNKRNIKSKDNINIVPLGDRVLLKPIKEEKSKTISGIIIPDTLSKEKPEQGIVVAVGEGKWNEDGDKRIALSVKVGDKVVFSKYGYDEIKIEDEEYYMLSESNILAVLK